jgi:pyruvate dehydrogenase E2 component (dihydrolipoamide acetyltransferase)
MMILGDKDEEVPQGFTDSPKAASVAAVSPAVATTGAEPAKPAAQPMGTAARTIASPRAKKLAEELGVNLAIVAGTGPAGKITEEDVKRAHSTSSGQAASTKAATPAAAAAAEVKLGGAIPLTKKQRLTAERMVESKRGIPCFYLTIKADVTDLVELRTKLNTSSLQAGQAKISYNDFIIRAVAIGLQKFPIMTGQLVSDTIKLADTINIGLAVSTPNGLVVPVVKDAHKMDLKQIVTAVKVLVEKAQNEKLLLTDLEGACITVSNLGAFGIESFIPVVIPGQCSILGIGRITDTSIPKKGDRKLMSMTLSVDHKVANGDYAAQFLDLVRKLLEDASTFV